MSSAEKDNWSTDTYRQAAGFVPKLATKVVDWLDVQPDDRILDLGCGGACLHPRL
jgi:cyclopropane fatty-acyl-phospholipid synthase-like methyltransferase